MKTTEQVLTEVMQRHNASPFDIGMTLCKEAMDLYAKEMALDYYSWLANRMFNIPQNKRTRTPTEEELYLFNKYQQEKSSLK